MGNITDYLGIRVSKDLYEDFKEYCKHRDISVAFSIELLVDECIKRQNVPFSIGSSNESNIKYSGNESRKSILLERNKRELFQKVCDEHICLKMSNVVKAFMIYCVTYNPKLPYSFDKDGMS